MTAKESAKELPKKAKKETVPKENNDPMPAKPNEKEFESRLLEIKEKIDKKKEGMKALSDKIEKANVGKEEYEEKRQNLYNALDVIKTEKAEMIQKVREINEATRAAQKETRENERNLKTMEKSMQALTEEGIDKEVQEIEFKMSTSTMTLKQEKEYMMRIKKLKAGRPAVQKQAKEYEQMKAKIDTTVLSDPATNQARVGELDSGIKGKKEAQDAAFAEIQKLKGERDNSTSGVKELIEKKKEIKVEVDGLIAERQKITDEKRKLQKEFNEWEKRQRQERAKKLDEQWKAEQAVWEAEQAERELQKPNPYLAETTLLEQTIVYCKGLLPKEECAVAEESKDLSHNNPEGAKILVSKKDRDKEMYFAATKKKAIRKKGEKKSVSIKHTADTFAIFDQLKMPAPLTTGDVGGLLEKLESSLAAYNDKVKVWESERKKKLEAAAEAKATAETAETA